ncbi:MAG: protein-L-isoaspartate O-methyltransferase [Nitrospirae bacterium RBG_19FT_COMBO_42_15]|nr:MAG: protein-L-isoaspartate O-methyltransferase [Nitrospirae bacterium RBG_19FT_COMBO_42_15]
MNFDAARNRMVDEQLIPRGINEPRVLSAMRKVPRHLFVEEALQDRAYGDYALPIGEKQTISQPYMVALMTEALELSGSEIVLEIGTGSGYQAAILAELSRQVYSIERIASLALRARKVIEVLGYKNVDIKIYDGTLGWEEKAPFDGIIVTASAPDIPKSLTDQLKLGGRLVIPVGTRHFQTLIKVVKKKDGLVKMPLTECVFVPLIGAYGWGE